MASLINLALVMASVTPAVMGHMSMFTTSMYGVGEAPGFAYECECSLAYLRLAL